MRQLYIFFLFVVFISCKKDKVQPGPTAPDQPSYKPISTTLLPLLFDTSSYWIYSNGSTFDTLTLNSVTREELYVVPKSLKDETFLLNFHSTQFNSYSERFMGAIITRYWANDGWAYATNLAAGQSSGGLTFIGKLDTLVVGSQEFYNVSQMKVQQGSYFPNDMHLFYADYTGVIRKEILSGSSVIETWDLIESNVVMYPY